MEFTLNPAEQSEWEKKAVTIPTEETLPGTRQQIMARREQVAFKTVGISSSSVTERF